MRSPKQSDRPYEGMCFVTPLRPIRGWRSLLSRASLSYDFGASEQDWRPEKTTIGYILPEAVAVQYPAFSKNWPQRREMVGLLATRTGHLAIGGLLSGWQHERIVSEEDPDRARPLKDSSDLTLATADYISAPDGVMFIGRLPRLVIPRERLILAAQEDMPPEQWPALRASHPMPPDGQATARLRNPAQAAAAFQTLQDSRTLFPDL